MSPTRHGVLSLAEAVDSRDPFPEIDGSSTATLRLKRHMRCVAADADVTVLLTGESGTGKEHVAGAIHRASPRGHRPFVVVDCAALPSTLAEDALFGHVRGAFTGAVDDRAGPFERGNGGTVLLDEVGDLPLELQMKLLRALQSRTVQRLGGRHDISFDVRIIAATNVDLARARQQGRFRADLYYRLKVYEIRLPPLRARGEADLRALVLSILESLASRRRRAPPVLAERIWERLLQYGWPGNVRELQNTLERMLVAAAGDRVLGLEHLPDDFGGDGAGGMTRAPLPDDGAVRDALERNGFRIARAASELGLSRHQLYRLVKRSGSLRPAAGP